MTRVSLKEAYDNKDVIAQIYAIRDTAESAEDSAEQAVTTANTASDHVDALVPQVEGAVANANSASASAQASAQTVAGYENRLANVEDATEDLSGDLNAVTLRVTTAEGDIVTIQGRVTALETADGQNVKINRINDYAIGLSGNQICTGIKEGRFYGYRVRNATAVNAGVWLRYCSLSASYNIALAEILSSYGNNNTFYGLFFWGGGSVYGRSTSIINHNGTGDTTKAVILTNTETNEKELWIYVVNVQAVNNMLVDFKNGDFTLNVTYYNTEHAQLPTEGYGTPIYVVGSA